MGQQFKPVQKGKEQPKVAQKPAQQPAKQPQKTQVQPSKASSKR